MKRIIVIICIAVSYSAMSPLMAVEKPVNDAGVFTIQAGTGFGLNTIAWSRYSPVYNPNFYIVPPVIISGNFGIFDLISVGFLVGYEGFGWNLSPQNYSVSFIKIGVRSDFHFNRWIKVSRLDIYAGVIFGVDIAAYSGGLPDNVAYRAPAYFLWNVQIGARYYFTENFGFWAEIGCGYSIISGGVIFKI